MKAFVLSLNYSDLIVATSPFIEAMFLGLHHAARKGYSRPICYLTMNRISVLNGLTVFLDVYEE